MATSKDKEGATNPRGIPFAPFVDKVEDYVSSRTEVEGTLRSFQEMISKYQFMELNTQRRAAGLKTKIPDIQKTLETVQFLKTQKPDSEPLETTFELNDTLYAKALVPTTEEAEVLLEGKLDAAQKNLTNCEDDLDFLREQITTLEVATARVYNWDIQERRKDKTSGKDESK